MMIPKVFFSLWTPLYGYALLFASDLPDASITEKYSVQGLLIIAIGFLYFWLSQEKKARETMMEKYEKIIAEQANQNREHIREIKTEHANNIRDIKAEHANNIREIREDKDKQIATLQQQVNESKRRTDRIDGLNGKPVS